MLACGLLDVNALMDLKLDTVPYLYSARKKRKGRGGDVFDRVRGVRIREELAARKKKEQNKKTCDIHSELGLLLPAYSCCSMQNSTPRVVYSPFLSIPISPPTIPSLKVCLLPFASVTLVVNLPYQSPLLRVTESKVFRPSKPTVPLSCKIDPRT